MTRQVMDRNLSLDIPGTWQFVRSIKRLIEDTLGDFPESFRYSASMVAAELVGNAIKYTDRTASPALPRFSMEITGTRVVIAVSNTVTSAERIREVKTRIDQLAVPANREALYLQRMEELLSGNSTGSQLGLYRIGYEGAFDLSCTYSESEQLLTIRASRGLS